MNLNYVNVNDLGFLQNHVHIYDGHNVGNEIDPLTAEVEGINPRSHVGVNTSVYGNILNVPSWEQYITNLNDLVLNECAYMLKFVDSLIVNFLASIVRNRDFNGLKIKEQDRRKAKKLAGLARKFEGVLKNWRLEFTNTINELRQTLINIQSTLSNLEIATSKRDFTYNELGLSFLSVNVAYRKGIKRIQSTLMKQYQTFNKHYMVMKQQVRNYLSGHLVVQRKIAFNLKDFEEFSSQRIDTTALFEKLEHLQTLVTLSHRDVTQFRTPTSLRQERFIFDDSPVRQVLRQLTQTSRRFLNEGELLNYLRKTFVLTKDTRPFYDEFIEILRSPVYDGMDDAKNIIAAMEAARHEFEPDARAENIRNNMRNTNNPIMVKELINLTTRLINHMNDDESIAQFEDLNRQLQVHYDAVRVAAAAN